ncbi:hypothetical protein F6X50_19690 [Dickeya dianthicola]|nr:hypothetical protein [Dickeya dianthicola]MZI91263.1 hypothetical protein [Dickeya dianthicola]
MTVLRLLGRHCPEPTQHGAAHAVTGSQTALPPARNARAALEGENAVVRWARQQGRLPLKSSRCLQGTTATVIFCLAHILWAQPSQYDFA